MSEAPPKKKKKKLLIDTKNYVSEGKGVSTLDLIKDPRANDAAWATLEEDEMESVKKPVDPMPLTDLEVLKRKKYKKIEKIIVKKGPVKDNPPVESEPDEPDEPVVEITAGLRINLINSRAAEHQEIYVKRTNIERYLLAGIENVDVLNDPDLLNHYQNNKTVVKRQLNKTTKDICKLICDRYPEIIETVLSHEAFIYDSIEMILNEKLSGSTLSDEDKKEMAAGCISIIKSKMG